ncbi:MAG: hypothetical protein HUJ68_11570 [Clostridia bacterium]|nr:hypothetical protein [Clostridia bacterium]
MEYEINLLPINTTYDYSKYKNRNEITYTEMAEDLEEFLYLVETSYSGFEDAISRGLKLNKQKQKILSLYENQEIIRIEDFLKTLYELFEPYIKDYHAQLSYRNHQFRFIQPAKCFFSDVYIKKEGDIFFVVDSKFENISIGQKYNDDEKYLFPYPSYGKDVFRLGIISKEAIPFMEVLFNSKIKIPVKFYDSLSEDFVFFQKETFHSIYLKYNSCTFECDSEFVIHQEFLNSVKNCKDKKFVIIDVRGNRGGTDEFLYNFYLSLFYGENLKNVDYHPAQYKQIYSPAIIDSIYSELNKAVVNTNSSRWDKKRIIKMKNEMKRHPKKVIISHGDNLTPEIKPIEKQSFAGKIIVITDSYTLSSGEEFIVVGKFLGNNNFIHIGQNTGGAQLYGNIHNYFLSNSGIEVILGTTDFSCQAKGVSSFKGEGYGYFPDYWSTNEDLNETIFTITKDEEMLSLLKEVL